MFARILVLVLVGAVAWAVVARASPAAGPDRVHTVQPGDTLWSIAAERYEGDPREGVWRLQKRNGLADAALTPGMVLHLPR